jgi:hypothetical protein
MAENRRDNQGQNRPQQKTIPRKTVKLQINPSEMTRNGDTVSIPIIVTASQGDQILGNAPLIVRHRFPGETATEHSFLTNSNTGQVRKTISVRPGNKKTILFETQLSGLNVFSEELEIPLPEVASPPKQETDFELDVVPLKDGKNRIVVSVFPPKEGVNFLALSRHLPNGQQIFPSDENGIAQVEITIPAGEKDSVIIRQMGTNKDEEIVLRGQKKEIPACDSTGCPSNPIFSFFAGFKKGKEK